MVISKRIEIDYGHTLPGHYSFCNQVHGHRAVVIAYFSGCINQDYGSSSEGMVIDFSVCKDIMMNVIHDKLDHGFAVWKKDNRTVSIRYNEIAYVEVSTLEFIRQRNSKVLITDSPPTAEYLAEWALEEISKKLKSINNNIKVVKVKWYETPNNCAVAVYE